MLSHISRKGFTLLEVIVVLMISGLISVILIQGLSLVLTTRLRVNDALSDLDVKGVQANILSTPLRGVLPDYTDGPNVFLGAKTQLRGLTLSPLQGTYGAPTGFGMSIEFAGLENVTTLTYSERGYEPIELARWPGNVGEFSYLGRKGSWKEAWPPPGDDIKQAPRTIRLVTGLQETAFVVRVMGPHDRVGRLQDGPFGAVQ